MTQSHFMDQGKNMIIILALINYFVLCIQNCFQKIIISHKVYESLVNI